jgi:hypothetical protein
MSEINGIFNKHLESKKHVVGVGYGFKNGDGERALVVLVDRKVPLEILSVADQIPSYIESIQTDVIEVGEIKVTPPQGVDPKGRFRPALGGVSVGHFQISAGTLGAIVRDVETGRKLILSNNHVLANSNLGGYGDPILQPGPYDGGTILEDQIATLERFVPIDFTGESTCPIAGGVARLINVVARLLGAAHRLEAVRTQQKVNIMDAALARPMDDSLVIDHILNIGRVEGITDSVLGMRVRKQGRTTDYTEGNIIVIGATINVNYGDQGTAQFQDQVVTTPMSDGGDSGSLVLAAKNTDPTLAVGLLFAGSSQTMIYNPIAPILGRLSIYF